MVGRHRVLPVPVTSARPTPHPHHRPAARRSSTIAPPLARRSPAARPLSPRRSPTIGPPVGLRRIEQTTGYPLAFGVLYCYTSGEPCTRRDNPDAVQLATRAFRQSRRAGRQPVSVRPVRPVRPALPTTPSDSGCTGRIAPSRGVWLAPETPSRGSGLVLTAEIHDSRKRRAVRRSRRGRNSAATHTCSTRTPIEGASSTERRGGEGRTV